MLNDINIPSVLLATFINFSVITLWFSPALFGPVWLRALGKTGEDGKQLITLRSLALALLFLFIFNCGLEIAANQTRTVGMSEGIMLGLTVWFFLVFAQVGIMLALERRSVVLNSIYSGLFMVIAVISSALFAMWR